MSVHAPQAAAGEAEDAACVRRIVAASGSSFGFAMGFLPAPRRRSIRALYAFCRIVDDIVDDDAGDGTEDGAGHQGDAARALDGWEEEIARSRRGTPRTAVGAEVARAMDRHALPAEEFVLLVEGMRMDLSPIVAPSAERLGTYVRRVAGSVGLLSMRCFGAWRGEASQRFALALARGLQLTNILRDVAEDAGRGRLYLPAHVLAQAGIPADPQAAARHPALPHARALLGAEARAAYAEAAGEIAAHSRARLLPALLMMGPYERLLTRMEADWTRAPRRRSGFGKLVDGTLCAAQGGR